MAAVSDQIRYIARQAFLMQLQATNAMVTTRANGVRVPGFEVVAGQMRELSHELVHCLAALRTATAGWLAAVSRRAAGQRSVRVLTASATGSPACARIAAPAIASLRAHLEADVGGGAARRAFLAVLDDSRRLAATGCILARTAKLEATYGAELAGPLTSCAVSFTELADSVDESVRTIARRLADRTWSQP